MRITLMTHGTRGDVQPLLILALELESRGHETRLAVPENTAQMVKRFGLRVDPLPLDSQAFLESESVTSALGAGNTRVFMQELREASRQHAVETTKALHAATSDAEMIISGPLMEDRAVVIAEAKEIPIILLHTFPMRPTKVVANPMVTRRSSVIPGFNYLTHLLYESSSWKARSAGINQLRDAMGLAPTKLSTQRRARLQNVIELQAYSPNLFNGLRWPAYRPMVGWMRFADDQRDTVGEAGIDDGLVEWIGDEEPPIYFGFGSMPVANPEATLAMIEKAVESLGARAIVSAGWADLGAGASVGSPDRVRVVGSVDHDSLLPRCRAAVHHGGSGTTGATIHAGLPTLICSVLLDQFMWGQRLEKIGVGQQLPFAQLNLKSLTLKLQQLLEPAIMTQASALGVRVREEPSAAVRAAEIVDRVSADTVAR